MSQLVAVYVLLIENNKAIKKLQKEVDSLKSSIDLKSLSENVKKDVLKHVYIPLGYDRIKVFR
jgi:hypothetical protein